ncbi:MAG: hypothetical protein WC916_02735 [Candidatus Woesearchaeota archaeon]
MKFDEYINNMNEDELLIFEKDLREGYIQKYLDRKKEFYKIKGKQCPVCDNHVEEDCFVFIWGEPSLRKKAHFCGIDCLEYFITNVIKKSITKQKKLKTVSIEQEKAVKNKN